MATVSADSAKKNRNPNGQPKWLSILLGRGSILFGSLLLLAIVPARWSLFEIDHQMANLAGIGLSLLGMMSIYVGIWILAARSWIHHLLFLVTPVSLVGLISTCVEFVGFTGETLPVFRAKSWRTASLKSALPPGSAADPTLGENLPETINHSLLQFESTQFLGNDRLGIIDSPTFSVDWANRPPKVAWKQSIGAGWSSFAVAKGLAITLEQSESGECVTAYRLDNGKQVWQTAFPGRHFQAFGGLGPRSTPTIVGNEIYVQTAMGIVARLNLQDGETRWQQDLLALAEIDQATAEQSVAWGRSGSPLIVGDQVVVPFGGKTGAPDLKALISLDRQSGDVLWQNGNAQIAYASPMLLTLCGVSQIVSVNEECATGHNPVSGEELWRTPWPSRSNGDACASQPVAVGDSRVLLGKGYALGSKVVELQFGGDLAINPYDPKEWKVSDVWVNARVLKTKFTSAILSDNVLFALSDGVLECVDPKDGTRIWRGKRYGQGQLIVVNGHLVISAEDGRIVLVKADRDSAGTEVAVVPALEGITWNVPTVAGPYLLVRNGEQVTCLISEKDADELGTTIAP
jgi:outer membrane protein assembly factor BamB